MLCVSFTCGIGELTLLLETDDAEQGATIDVRLVQWTRHNVSMGREVFLDDLDRIICPVNFASRPRHFVDRDIILPAVGEGVRRVKKAHRPYLPQHALRLFRIFKLAVSLQSRDVDEQVLFDDAEQCACSICGHTHAPVEQCALCMLSAHTSCATSVTHATRQRSTTFSCVPRLPLRQLPNIILGSTEPASGSSTARVAVGSSWGSFLGILCLHCLHCLHHHVTCRESNSLTESARLH